MARLAHFFRRPCSPSLNVFQEETFAFEKAITAEKAKQNEKEKIRKYTND